MQNRQKQTSLADRIPSKVWVETVYVYFKDDAGNVSSVATDTINLYSAISTVPSQSGTLTYSGSAQSPSWSNYDSNKLTLGGTTSKTDAGTYTATFTPMTNYIWSDGSTTVKSVNWSIGKAAGSLTLSNSSVSLNVGATVNVTATRSGNGTVSATSNNTGVATVSVSGTTITITGKASGTATVTVSVAAGTNHTAPNSKTISVTVNALAGNYVLNTLKPSGLNTTPEGGLYRFQGTNDTVNNYICFGTSDKSTCTGDVDKYMYRIIGIDSSGQLKLIKKEALNTAYEWHTDDTNITWPSSTLYKGLNGNYYLNNTTYVSSGWSDKIATTTWKYGDTSSDDYTAANMYSIENGWSTATSSKIGLMYMHDYYYAYQSGGLNCSSSSGNNSTCKISWLHLWDSGASNTETELIISRYGYATYSSYYVWFVQSAGFVNKGTLSSARLVRPVFFLTSDVSYVSGSGTQADPIIIQ